jgi:hypothetical protein
MTSPVGAGQAIIILNSPFLDMMGQGRRVGFVLLMTIAILLAMQFVPLAKAENGNETVATPTYDLPPELVPANHVVYMSIWIIDLYGYDYKEGDYTFDFWAIFSWSDKNITTVDWYLMNGYPVTPASKELVSTIEQNNITSEVWRVRAVFDVDIIPEEYPFDTVKLPILIEVLNHGYSTYLQWLESESGISPDFLEVGWTLNGLEYSVTNNSYPYGITLSNAEMDVVLTRDTYAALYQTIIPPIIFCIVSAFSFAFKIEDDTGFSIRIGLNTSMLITAVLFNLAETDKIPPITQFTLYSIFEISVLVFISMNLITTIVGYMGWKYKNDSRFVKTINRLGLLASFLVPILVIGIIYLVSVI